MYMNPIKEIRCDFYSLNNIICGEEFDDGTKFWRKNNLFHKEDGPACEFYDIKEFWLDGMQFSEYEWKKLVERQT